MRNFSLILILQEDIRGTITFCTSEIIYLRGIMKNFRNGFYKFVFSDGRIVQSDPNSSVHHFAHVVLLITYEGYPNQRHSVMRGFLETLQTALCYEQPDVRMS
jgi:hypothetical protein